MKTIVDYFDPRIYEHLEAWESVRHSPNVSYLSTHFAIACGIDELDYEWPAEWGQLIRDKMADAWLEQHLGSETDENTSMRIVDVDAAFDAIHGSLKPPKRKVNRQRFFSTIPPRL